MRSFIRYLVVSVVVLLALPCLSAQAQTCMITDPTSVPMETWTSGIGASEYVTFSHSGGFS